jgi:sortase A
MKGIDLLERLAWTGGLLAVGAWSLVHVSGTTGAQQELDRFKVARAEKAAASMTQPKPPDQKLWSLVRVRAWQETQLRPAPPPLGVLRIRRVGLEVPLLEGTDDWTLNRAAGHIAGTANPGAAGNSGIAGHRDGFFRVLREVETGDDLEIETLNETIAYRIERTWIVDPSDVSVLDQTPSPAVTLVTCYPFYFVGSAPQRFIVRAVRVAPAALPK